MSETKPIVSVGMPVYNGAAYLRRALDSLLAQTYENFELIISDNASQDETESICRAYAARDPRIRYLRQDHNRGAAFNYNVVVREARGTYFKWAAHDDEIAPTFLSRCLEGFHHAPRTTVLVYPRTAYIDADSEVLSRFDDNMNLVQPHPAQRVLHLLRVLGRANPVFGLFRARALNRTRLIGSYLASDWVLLTELALQGEFRSLPEFLFFRRMHPEMSTAAHADHRSRSAWFDPQLARARWLMPRTRFVVSMARALWRIRMPRIERARCYLSVLAAYALRKMDGLRGVHGQRIAAIDAGLMQIKADQARAGFTSNDYDAAARACRELLAIHPRHPDGLHIMGLIRLRAGAAADAVGYLRHATDRAPWRASYWNSLGVALRSSGKLADAIASYREATRRRPDYAEAYNNLGTAQRLAGDASQARHDFERALALRPEYAEAHVNLGELLSEGGDRAGALASYRRALALRPGLEPAARHLAEMEETP